jgi:hypothetical protein
VKSRHAQLKEELADACEQYFREITDVGWSADRLAETQRRLCRIAVRLHLFEQGMRFAKRGAA